MRKCSSLVAFVAGLMLLPSPLAAAPGRSRMASDPRAGSAQVTHFEESVRSAYQNLDALSEHQVRFDLRDFITVPESEFDRVTAYDVTTLPGGDLVDVVVHSRLVGDSLVTSYEFKWVHADSHLLTPGGQEAASMPLDEVLSKNAESDPLLRRVAYLTSYRVTVFLDGRHRAYRAAFLWVRDENDTLKPGPLDHVVQGLELVLRDEMPSSPGGLDSEPNVQPIIESVDVGRASCVADSSPRLAGKTLLAPRHNWGKVPGDGEHRYVSQDLAAVDRYRTEYRSRWFVRSGWMQRGNRLRLEKLPGRAQGASRGRNRGDRVGFRKI